jgi:hypothetical protein
MQTGACRESHTPNEPLRRAPGCSGAERLLLPSPLRLLSLRLRSVLCYGSRWSHAERSPDSTREFGEQTGPIHPVAPVPIHLGSGLRHRAIGVQRFCGACLLPLLPLLLSLPLLSLLPLLPWLVWLGRSLRLNRLRVLERRRTWGRRTSRRRALGRRSLGRRRSFWRRSSLNAPAYAARKAV